MKLIIAGSRTFKYTRINYRMMCQAVNKAVHMLEQLESDINFACKFTTIISGGAQGPDQMGAQWARDNNLEVEEYLPDWDANGRAAGMIRNKEMGLNADWLLAIWDGESKGTEHMINFMKDINKPVYILMYSDEALAVEDNKKPAGSLYSNDGEIYVDRETILEV